MKCPTTLTVATLLLAIGFAHSTSQAGDADTVFSDYSDDDTPLEIVSVDYIPTEEISHESTTDTPFLDDSVVRTSHDIPIKSAGQAPEPRIKRSFSLGSLSDNRTRQVASGTISRPWANVVVRRGQSNHVAPENQTTRVDRGSEPNRCVPKTYASLGPSSQQDDLTCRNAERSGST